MQIEGSTALVTGANRGIGKAFVEELLARGAAKVYAGARDPGSVTSEDPRVVPVALDVTDPESIARAAQNADVEIVVNNAGIGRPALPLAATREEAREQFETNVLGVLSMTQSFAPVLERNGGGAFVNVLSVVSWLAMPQLATYSASKSAAWSYTNSARVELREQGTDVVGVHVGFVDTDLTAGFDAEKVAPGDVARAALDGLEAGEPEVAVDERSRQVKAALSQDQTVLYAA